MHSTENILFCCTNLAAFTYHTKMISLYFNITFETKKVLAIYVAIYVAAHIISESLDCAEFVHNIAS